MARNKQRNFTEYQPEHDIELPKASIDEDVWTGIGSSLYNLIILTIGNRSRLNRQLDVGNAYYEQRDTVEKVGEDIPSPGSPTTLTPLVAVAVDEFASRISGTVLVERPVIVRGNDTPANENQHAVEQFYNNKYTDLMWDEAIDTCIQLGGRDGTAIMRVTWKDYTTERVHRVLQEMPDGTQKRVSQRIKSRAYSDVEWRPIELRDFLVIPNEARSVEEADAVCEKIYMDEPLLQSMVEQGTLDADAVERALYSVNPGQSELYTDPQGVSTYTINNLIDVGDISVSTVNGLKMNRGPIRVWEIHTDLYDMDGDGVSEENVFWIHDQTQILLGWAPFEYEGGRPYFNYAPWPYANRFYGSSIPLRVQPYQDEADAQQLARLEALDRINIPVYQVEESVTIRESDKKLSTLEILRVPDGSNNPIKLIQPPAYPENSLQEQQQIQMQADRVVGAPQSASVPNPGDMQKAGGGRQSARAAQSQAQVQSQQTNKVLKRTRRWMLKMFKYTNGLYKQYGPGQMEVVVQAQEGAQKVTLPKEVLSLDYTFSVAGIGGPMDKEKNQEMAQGLYQQLMGNPLVQGDLSLVYNITAMLLESHDVPEVTRYIGTMENAKQKEQQRQQAQQAQQQAEMTKQVLSHTDIKGGAGGQQ
jgi:hypothetical protein